MNINTLATATVIAEIRIHGRALPARVRVRSMICPATRLPATMRIAERMGKMVRKVSTPPVVSPANSTLRKYSTRNEPNRQFANKPQKGPTR